MFVEAQHFHSARGNSRLGTTSVIWAGCGNARVWFLRDAAGLGWTLGLVYQEAAGCTELRVGVYMYVCVFMYI